MEAMELTKLLTRLPMLAQYLHNVTGLLMNKERLF